MTGIKAVPFVDTILRNKRLILGVCFIAALATFITLKFFVKPKFESKAVVYAAQTYTESLIMPPLEFGYDIHAEQYIQMMRANEVRDSLVDRFNLVEHYGIDTTEDKKWRDLLHLTYLKNVWIDQTEYKAIDVNVLDQSPDTAAMMANAIVEIGAHLKVKKFEDDVKQSYKARLREFKAKQGEVDSLQKLMIEYGEKIDRSTRYNEVNVTFERIRSGYQGELARLNQLKGKCETIQNFLSTERPTHYVISKAEPNFKKVSPKVVVSTLVTALMVGILSILLLAFWERIRSL